MNLPIPIPSTIDRRRPEGLAAWLLRRLHAVRRTGPAEHTLHHIETLALGGRYQVILLECSGQRYLVGCGADTIHTIVPVVASSTPCECQP